MSFVALATEKFTIVSLPRRWRSQAHNAQHAPIVGTVDRASPYLEFLQGIRSGVRVVEVVDDGAAGPDEEGAGVPIVRRLKDPPEIVRH